MVASVNNVAEEGFFCSENAFAFNNRLVKIYMTPIEQ